MEGYRLEPHNFGPSGVKNFPWNICKYCGLVLLRNAFTEWCRKMGCNNKDHPQYEAKRRELTDR